MTDYLPVFDVPLTAQVLLGFLDRSLGFVSFDLRRLGAVHRPALIPVEPPIDKPTKSLGEKHDDLNGGFSQVLNTH